jgi:3,5-epimerase/4-reductase
MYWATHTAFGVLMQAMVESLLKEFPNVLTLRVRMPIVADLTYPRNFITKIIKYEKVIVAMDKHQFLACTLKAEDGRRWKPTFLRLSLQVVNIPNSMTVLPELLPYAIEMVRILTA